jgi:hypothetical protein
MAPLPPFIATMGECYVCLLEKPLFKYYQCDHEICETCHDEWVGGCPMCREPPLVVRNISELALKHGVQSHEKFMFFILLWSVTEKPNEVLALVYTKHQDSVEDFVMILYGDGRYVTPQDEEDQKSLTSFFNNSLSQGKWSDKIEPHELFYDDDTDIPLEIDEIVANYES